MLRDKPNLLQHRVAMWVGRYLLFDLVSALTVGVDQPESRHPGTPSASHSTLCPASRFSSEKKSAPSVTINPMSEMQA